jgi:hypothetical protein
VTTEAVIEFDGLFVRDSARFFVIDNTIELNGQNGVWLQLARHAEISANVIASNSCAAPAAYDNVQINTSSSDNLIAENDFTAVVPNLTTSPRFDICISDPDCVGNRLLRNLVRSDQGDRARILDNGSQTQITPPPMDLAESRNSRRRPPASRWRSAKRFTPSG